MKDVLVGAHFSIAGGLHRAFADADKYGCTAMQIFTQNSNTWKIRELRNKEIEEFFKRKKVSKVKRIISHSSYLINLGGPDKEKRKKSIEALEGEIIRAEALEIESLVLHPGSHVGTSVKEGIKRIASGLNSVLDKIPGKNTDIILETTAGQGDSIGHRCDEISEIIEKVENKERIGVCIDTCHIFAAGYDIRTKEKYDSFMKEAENSFGLNYLKCIHLNDSKKDLGSRLDRHEHLGLGFIGEDAFKFIMKDKRLAEVPKILETPHEADGKDMNFVNFNKLYSMAQ